MILMEFITNTVLIAVIGVLIGVVVGLLIGRVRRWRTQESDTSGEPWTLQDLRDLHALGELTDEEFERLKAAMLAAYESPSSESGPEESGSDDATG